MNIDIGRITEQVNLLWDRWSAVVIVAAVAALLLVALAVVRQWRRRDFSGKASIGFAAVQAGVTYAVVLGVYEFFGHVLGLPTAEAVVLAVFIEAAVWAAVGFIAAHTKTGREGFGPAGPFFWVAVLGGGTLAVLGSESAEVALGRSVIVVLGAYMWYLRLVQIIRRPDRTRFTWTWTPTRLLQMLGAVQPATDDAATEGDAAREYQVRRLARLIRWSNSSRPWCWLGGWLLTKRAETTTEDVLAEARRRFAAAHVLRAQTRVDSPVMAATIAAVQQAEVTRQASESTDSPDLYLPDSWVNQTGESAGDSPRESRVPRPVSQPVTQVLIHRDESGDSDQGESGDSPVAESPVPDELIHRARTADSDPEIRMAWLWHATSGRASGRELARAGDVSPSTGIRRASRWRDAPPADPRR